MRKIERSNEQSEWQFRGSQHHTDCPGFSDPFTFVWSAVTRAYSIFLADSTASASRLIFRKWGYFFQRWRFCFFDFCYYSEWEKGKFFSQWGEKRWKNGSFQWWYSACCLCVHRRRSRPLMFGRNIAFATDSMLHPDRFFKGWIDEVFIFNTALEQEKIQRLMQTNRLD